MQDPSKPVSSETSFALSAQHLMAHPVFLRLLLLAVVVATVQLTIRYKTASYGEWTFRYDRVTGAVYRKAVLYPGAQWESLRFASLEQAVADEKDREQEERQQEIDDLQWTLDMIQMQQDQDRWEREMAGLEHPR
jgi:hypothetical protein